MSSQEHFGGPSLLIGAMREHIRDTPLPMPGHRPRLMSGRHRLNVRAGLAGTAACALVAAALLVFSGGGAGPTLAFGATLHANGTVTITLREIADVQKLNARLAALGTRIRVVPVARHCTAPIRLVQRGHIVSTARTLHASTLSGSIVSQTIRADTPPGRTLVIAATQGGMVSLGGQVVIGTAPSCVGYPTTTKPFLIYTHK
jgi:hypothetical protein